MQRNSIKNAERQVQAKERFLIQYYNRISDCKAVFIFQIPESSLAFLLQLDYRRITDSFIKEDLRDGNSMQQCADKYGLTIETVRDIGRKIGTHK